MQPSVPEYKCLQMQHSPVDRCTGFGSSHAASCANTQGLAAPIQPCMLEQRCKPNAAQGQSTCACCPIADLCTGARKLASPLRPCADRVASYGKIGQHAILHVGNMGCWSSRHSGASGMSPIPLIGLHALGSALSVVCDSRAGSGFGCWVYAFLLLCAFVHFCYTPGLQMQAPIHPPIPLYRAISKHECRSIGSP